MLFVKFAALQQCLKTVICFMCFFHDCCSCRLPGVCPRVASVSECCSTPYSLLGMTFVVSYLAMGLLNLCRFYLGGYAAVQNDNVMHRSGTM